jgi:hypothetical protein
MHWSLWALGAEFSRCQAITNSLTRVATMECHLANGHKRTFYTAAADNGRYLHSASYTCDCNTDSVQSLKLKR